VDVLSALLQHQQLLRLLFLRACLILQACSAIAPVPSAMLLLQQPPLQGLSQLQSPPWHLGVLQGAGQRQQLQALALCRQCLVRRAAAGCMRHTPAC
jgi:hypothetical protein